MGLIDIIKESGKRARGLALAGVLGLSGCANWEPGPLHPSRLLFDGTVFSRQNQQQTTNMNNQGQTNFYENASNNNTVQISPNRKSFCDTVIIFDENTLSASGVKKDFKGNEPIVFTAVIQYDKSGEVKLSVLERTNGKKIYEKYSGIRAIGGNTVFFQRENAKIFSQYGSSFDYCWKVGDEVVANSYFNIEKE